MTGCLRQRLSYLPSRGDHKALAPLYLHVLQRRHTASPTQYLGRDGPPHWDFLLQTCRQPHGSHGLGVVEGNTRCFDQLVTCGEWAASSRDDLDRQGVPAPLLARPPREWPCRRGRLHPTEAVPAERELSPWTLSRELVALQCPLSAAAKGSHDPPAANWHPCAWYVHGTAGYTHPAW